MSMDTSSERNNVDWSRYGLGNEESYNYSNRVRPRGNSTGFVDLGNEYQYASGGHQASGANEIFAEVQGDKPWWRTNFFISQPVLFGTWDGVFTSVVINIFGVIVFLRSGFIVAQAGILNGILIIIATVSLALISVLAAVGICERCRVESGGVYFLIAHTLGSRFGGSLGLLYCFGQAVGCALNVLGFGESMAGLLGFESNYKWAIRGFAAGAVLLLGVINVAGVKWVIKLQFILLLVVLCAGLNFMVGSFVNEDITNGFTGWSVENFLNNLWWSDEKDSPSLPPTIHYTWFQVFGIFFPTITGVLSGINMSGDLRAPSTDIPNGTLAAFGTSTFLYLVFVLFLGATCVRANLSTDFMIAKKVSAIPFLFLAGVYVSSISSCLGAMYGTPRVLQNIALENVIPAIGVLGKGRGPNKVPLYAMGVVATVTIAFIMVGDINYLAPIVTMPFLLTYACIDYCYFALAQTFDIQTKREERFRIQAQSPSYESRRYGSVVNENDNDLDHLFPERTRHKLGNTSNHKVPSENQNLPSNSESTNDIQNSDEQQTFNDNDRVTFRGGNQDSVNTTNAQINVNNEDDEPIAQPIIPIHSKTKNWYSNYCNRWVSLFGAILKIVIMMFVDVYYGVTCIFLVFLTWFYVGTANPAVKPGIASEFRLIVWLKSVVIRCFGKRTNEYEQIVVTPSCPGVDLRSDQLNEENEDFSSRRRYHQTSIIQGHYVDDV
ncbi:solute carrier family 12 member 8 [Contarinia nasturtii]|uniref:solute carrier family 12 member 8 n=1 Tax=Contarinia nasturtii TaxID=265458 RepID=UPI0012D3DC24|nr:solute carrier family 12 member 8 [Contarinia nasturtii]XP_031631208.1 solute carrier family 12 member 8 [Contarinia nasturtii]XP_031631216.1 solute carrier family 12 member 8 [Contarinia nasturtii]